MVKQQAEKQSTVSSVFFFLHSVYNESENDNLLGNRSCPMAIKLMLTPPNIRSSVHDRRAGYKKKKKKTQELADHKVPLHPPV